MSIKENSKQIKFANRARVFNYITDKQTLRVLPPKPNIRLNS